jgi:hypothetical protein
VVEAPYSILFAAIAATGQNIFISTDIPIPRFVESV